MAAEEGAGFDGSLDEAGVEDLPRYDVHRPAHPAAHPRGAVGGQLPQRRPVVDDIGGADLRECVENVWGDAVAARLVAREVGPVEQEHPQRRVGGQGAQGGARAGRPGPDDDHVQSSTPSSGRHQEDDVDQGDPDGRGEGAPCRCG